jgi:hypothetical protein
MLNDMKRWLCVMYWKEGGQSGYGQCSRKFQHSSPGRTEINHERIQSQRPLICSDFEMGIF